MNTRAEPRPHIHVVAGLLVENNRICITRRRTDAHQGGKWEFPGGKLEPNEGAFSGLQRELGEELGIEVHEATPFMQVRHAYCELDVLLDIWQVTRYGGAARGCEQQEMRWAEIARLDPNEFPAADRPVLRRLQLPLLYLISDVRRFGEDEFALRLERALGAGARLVQLREPQMDRASFCAYACKIAALCRRFGARLLINADPAWLPECEAHGVHLNSHRLMILSERPVSAEHWLGASCHNAAELQQAGLLQADVVVLGPVNPTASHPGGLHLGWERFAELCRDAPLSIYAIGGMVPDDLSRARAVGAFGLAMISGVWGREDLEAAVRKFSPAD